ncbi:hypothetical protein [Streptomyces sp. NPDC020298]|uniref:hypothetical protein n=1 Tax=unclassified Streptomyces TaxID=2593676 RepID=UPI0033E1EE2F
MMTPSGVVQMSITVCVMSETTWKNRAVNSWMASTVTMGSSALNCSVVVCAAR